ncbi:hypothetical protein Moror_3147 [Moniliophthora roreri MCA 2997]|uniref:Uncharacterized protein n=1 Tax=Moniliophthora roreri (strain MCA 2997) TaxID=1381753 RepID=V2X454_MONRO|nr:hypothetical protein Moror_3147 [Moniliophthora roreri MCA 2997]
MMSSCIIPTHYPYGVATTAFTSSLPVGSSSAIIPLLSQSMIRKLTFALLPTQVQPSNSAVISPGLGGFANVRRFILRLWFCFGSWIPDTANC